MATTHQAAPHSAAKTSEGERLEREIWADMKMPSSTTLEKKIAPDFLSIHTDGSRNRQQEIELIKKLKLGSYTLTNFKTQEHGDTIIVTYMAAVDEHIDGKHLSENATPRMSVWRKNKHNEWQIIAHANLHSLGKK